MPDTDSSLPDIDHQVTGLCVEPGLQNDRYTINSMLGHGTIGEVHDAYDIILGRNVAIKSLHEEYRESPGLLGRLQKEARGSAQLEHPNIIPVHELGMNERLGVYFTMKKVHGETLRKILDQLNAENPAYQDKYPLNVLLEIFLAVCNGVAFAHSIHLVASALWISGYLIHFGGKLLGRHSHSRA